MRRRTLFVVVWLVFVLLLAEVASRGYLRLAGGSLLHPARILYSFYPELEEVVDQPVVADDTDVDVLLLGGSALNPRWGSIAARIAERLTDELGRPIQIYNLAVEAHTTRDSLLKYERLGGQRFDLVVVYHGINEGRANNAPPDVFDEDYGHYSWYRFVNAIDEDSWLPILALPYAMKYARISVADRLGLSTVIPTSEPLPEWLVHGTDVKTAEPFRRNLSTIIDIARSRGEPLLLMTFAVHVDENYSREAFEHLQLDYWRHRAPIRWWGTPEGVLAAIEGHNAVIRELAAERGVPLVDQQSLIPGERRLYDDVCHLTIAGSELFVENMLPTLKTLIRPTEGP